jgi:hypothetical protein
MSDLTLWFRELCVVYGKRIVIGLVILLALVAVASAATRETVSFAVYRGSTIMERPATIDLCKQRAAEREEATPSYAHTCRVSYAYTQVATPPPPLPPVRSVTLTWTPPTQNTDGTALTNLPGYRLVWGTVGALSHTIELPANVTTYTLADMPAGSWSFGVMAINSQGNASELSNIASKTVL